jgi:hypothetical protein
VDGGVLTMRFGFGGLLSFGFATRAGFIAGAGEVFLVAAEVFVFFAGTADSDVVRARLVLRSPASVDSEMLRFFDDVDLDDVDSVVLVVVDDFIAAFESLVVILSI